MRHLSFVIPYYLNPGMLVVQYETWAAYAPDLRERIEVVIIDDGSPAAAIDVPRPPKLPPLRIYRVLEDRPWHQHGARNLGATVAHGPWLLMTDMDHVVPASSLEWLLELEDDRSAYTLGRVDAPHFGTTLDRHGRPKPHPNTFVLTKAMYAQVGGYDETFCGIYGTDSLFRSRLFERAEHRHLPDVPIIRYTRDLVPDASTTTLSRKEGRPPRVKAEILARKRREGTERDILVLAFPWERVL